MLHTARNREICRFTIESQRYKPVYHRICHDRALPNYTEASMVDMLFNTQQHVENNQLADTAKTVTSAWQKICIHNPGRLLKVSGKRDHEKRICWPKQRRLYDGPAKYLHSILADYRKCLEHEIMRK